MTTQNQQENVVIVINVYANQKHVANAQSIHIAKVVLKVNCPYVEA